MWLWAWRVVFVRGGGLPPYWWSGGELEGWALLHGEGAALLLGGGAELVRCIELEGEFELGFALEELLALWVQPSSTG